MVRDSVTIIPWPRSMEFTRIFLSRALLLQAFFPGHQSHGRVAIGNSVCAKTYKEKQPSLLATQERALQRWLCTGAHPWCVTRHHTWEHEGKDLERWNGARTTIPARGVSAVVTRCALSDPENNACASDILPNILYRGVIIPVVLPPSDFLASGSSYFTPLISPWLARWYTACIAC